MDSFDEIRRFGQKNGQFRRTSLNMCNNTEHIEQTVHVSTKQMFINNTLLLSARYGYFPGK